MNATGKSWEEWIKTIDGFGGAKMSHQEIASKLSQDGLIKSSWWAQSVTVGYEYAKGRRITGETKTAGFAVGVQKTIDKKAQEIWKFLMSKKGQKIWLGETYNFAPLAGYGYRTDSGISGEIRSVKLGEKIRISWKLPHWRSLSTLQIYLMPVGKKTSIRIHHEKLGGPKTRAEMKKHWLEVLNKIEHTLE